MSVKHVTPEEFKTVDIKPGTKERFLVRIGEMSTGSEVAIPVVVVSGRRDGPRVFIGAGVHAEETGAIEAVKRFGAQVRPDEVSGTMLVVPLQNPPAWAFRSRLYPLDAPSISDPFTMQRGAPGGIMTERVLSALVDSIGLNANFALDIHGTHLDSMNYPRTMTVITGDEPPQVHEKRLELSRQVGYEIIHLWKVPTGAAGGPTSILNSRGCPTISIEAGEGWRALEPFPAILIRGIRNFCKAAGSLSGELEMPGLQVEITSRLEITVSRGGMSHLYVKPGDYVRTGQVVGEVRDMFDDVVEELKTPINGIIVRCSLLPTVATGARICNVYQTDRAEEWKNRVVPELERQITISGTARPRN